MKYLFLLLLIYFGYRMFTKNSLQPPRERERRRDDDDDRLESPQPRFTKRGGDYFDYEEVED